MTSTAARGRAGEEAAAAWLAAEGWRVLARNFRTRAGEVDIIASRGNTLAFVEVKSWQAFTAADLAYSIDRRKQGRIARVALAYLARHAPARALRPRFDVVFAGPGPRGVRHIAGAFDGGID